MSPTILHITADFPDPLAPAKTTAIANLVDATAGYRHIVYSLNRVSSWGGVHSLQFADDRVAVAYGAPQWGVMLATRLGALARWIVDDLSTRQWMPHAVQAHKLTIEGLIAAPVARHLGVPLLCSLQAKTDVKILRARPDLRPRFGQIWHGARHAFPFSPRARDTAAALLGPRSGPTTLLPCITKANAMHRASVAREPRIISIFRLDDHRGKNANTLIRAVAAARRQIPDLSLDIYGAGRPRSFFELSRIIENHSVGQFVSLKGPIPNASVQDTIARYAALAMPTLRESYGMVFAEALLAGVPILHTRGWGLHGLYRDADTGYACADPTSHHEVAHGIVTILANEETLKSRIAELQCSGALDILRRDGIVEAYRTALDRAVGGATLPTSTPAPVSVAATNEARRVGSVAGTEVRTGALWPESADGRG
jgi:glycosyltransferase involved in cell wall biosynthesis